MKSPTLNRVQVLEEIEDLQSYSNCISLASVWRGMFAVQVRCKFVRIENVVRMFRGILLLSEVGGRESQARVPRSLVNMVKAMLKLFAVGAKGNPVRKGKFNAQGFRRLSYIELIRLTGFGRSTVAENIRHLKKAGLINAYQIENVDGSKGDWWVRFNPYAYQIWVLRLRAKSQGLSLDDPPTIAKNFDLPSPASRTLLSSYMQESASADAVAATAAVKKEIFEAPGSAESFERDRKQTFGFQLSDFTAMEEATAASVDRFQQFAREEILRSETGKIATILASVFPAITTASAVQLINLHNLVHHFIPALRLDAVVAQELVDLISNCPEALGRFSGITSDVQGFDIMLKFWPGISKEIWSSRLQPHDNNVFNARSTIGQFYHELDSPRFNDLQRLHKEAPGIYWLRLLSLGLIHKWSRAVMAAISQRARPYLMQSPVEYFILWKRFSLITRLCSIPLHFHERLLQEAMMTFAKINVWEEIKSIYGLEYDATIYERMQDL